MKFSRQGVSALAIATVASLGLAGCGGVKTSDSDSSNAKQIVIGASIPLSGPLAGFGSFEKFGYQEAVREANAAGGIDINGKKLKVKLKLLDDKTDPNTVSSNIDSLVSGDKVNGLLGSCTPALVIPGAIAAERAKTPFVTACSPVHGFGTTRKWNWAWDIFFDETKLPGTIFQSIADNNLQTNKEVALLHDNGPDGIALGQAMPIVSKAAGYNLVLNESFPTDATDLSAAVRKAKESGADILVVDAVTPQAVSIRKQMATAAYSPKIVAMEKGAEPQQFADALGKLADGVTVAAYWDPSFSFKGSAALAAEFKKQNGGSISQHIADTYTAAKVLLDAIRRAKSLDAAAINKQVAKTNAEYPVGPVKFGADHTSALGLTRAQWQNGQIKIVWPADRANAKFLFPFPKRVMTGWIQATAGGLLVGGLFAASALGLSLVLGVTRLVNLVHGDLVVVGSYLAFAVYAGIGLDPLLGLPLVAVAGALIGAAVQRTLLEPLAKHGADAPLITTFALSVVVENLLVLIFNGDTRSIQRPYTSAAWKIGPITVPDIYLIAFGVSLLVCAAVFVLVTRTSFGRRLRAASEDDRAAAVIGVRVGGLRTATYGLAAGTSAVAGGLLGMCFSFTPTSGTDYLLTGMAVVVIGGLGSIQGTVIGGLFLGLVEAWGAYLLGDGYRLFIGLIAFLILLVIRPQGLYGRTA